MHPATPGSTRNLPVESAPIARAHRAALAITLDAYVAQWLARRRHVVKRRTTETYSDVLRLHILPHVGDRDVLEISRGVIVQLLDLLATRRRPRTVRLTYNALHAVLADAVEAGILAYNPADRLAKRYPIPKDEAPCYTRPQVLAFLGVANDYGDDWATYFSTMFGAGLRVGETRGLQRWDVALQHAEIRVVRGLDRHHGIDAGKDETPKSSRARVVPVVKSVLPALTDIVEASARSRGSWLFPLTIGPTGYKRQRDAFRAIAGDAGVPMFSPKAFRHAFGSTLAQLNVDIRTIQKFMGHADPRTTMRYADHYPVRRPPQLDET